ncbi:hypothetical protein FD755_020404 [Muntiacus reevesi]|uniref:Core shell protein Gag P30 domain-containing protein n=1 Tax=Muntiacus reevesi TaxID=9886 RepID=A0A5N3WYZ0_MUNRE|nr:hypothetical protein FD755_020404 [Muntiacus reevesi]
MGGSSSKPTVLDYYRVKMTSRKLCNYCELNWPSFDVVTGTLGHPDQFPYIDSCLLIVQTLPPWARFCTNTQEQSRVFVAQPLRKKKKEEEKHTFQGDPVEDPLLPLPFVPLTPQAPAQSALNLLPDSPPRSMFPEPTHEQDSSPKPVGKQLCSAKQSNHQATARQMLLQKTQGPQQVKKDSSVQSGHSMLYYQSFSTAGLLNWKHHNPACRQFLMSFFTTEEKLRFSTEAQKWLRGQAPTEVLNVEGWAQEAMPKMRPNWDFNTREGQEALVGAKKPTNMSKITMIIQIAEETPTDFYESVLDIQPMINAAFVAQSHADIQRKLQKLESFTGMNATQLLEVVNKIFVN